MPDLPTLTLPQAQFDRVVAAFPGANLAEKAAAYKVWLGNRLIDRVGEVDLNKAMLAVQSSLPARQPEPELPTT